MTNARRHIGLDGFEYPGFHDFVHARIRSDGVIANHPLAMPLRC
jgi:hypothetical protein